MEEQVRTWRDICDEAYLRCQLGDRITVWQLIGEDQVESEEEEEQLKELD